MSYAIAMWSGPRNISTAMMRSWESRGDTAVHDEPFYAHYLHHTGVDHPGAAEIIAHYETDWRKVVTQLTGATPDGKTYYYQKHMTHHLLPHMDFKWVLNLRNAFLIRDPREMLLSYIKVVPDATLEGTGLPQQVSLFKQITERIGTPPPVVDARDVQENTAATLQKLCDALNVPFTPAMLSWEAGQRASDGIWAPYWYATVERSTGFAPYKPKTTHLPERYHDLLAACQPLYEEMAAHKL